VALEKGCPGVRPEAVQRSPGHHLHRLSYSCCRAVGSWTAMSSFCLAGASQRRCQPGWSDNDLFKVIDCPHRVHDGLDPPLAEGALGLAEKPTAGCTGKRSGGGTASHRWHRPSCPGTLGSGLPPLWPCSPSAAVGWVELEMTISSLLQALQQPLSR